MVAKIETLTGVLTFTAFPDSSHNSVGGTKTLGRKAQPYTSACGREPTKKRDKIRTQGYQKNNKVLHQTYIKK